ncbi:MAG: hypothetical protein LBG28_01505 [Tannerella sp.]|jgi:hypothetical protein|nr:hypothetical protein [Tannerella sp.]
MKTIKYIFITLLAAIALSLASCEKMLDNEQHGAYLPEDFYKTNEEAEQALATLYAYYSNFGHVLQYLLLEKPAV